MSNQKTPQYLAARHPTQEKEDRRRRRREQQYGVPVARPGVVQRTTAVNPADREARVSAVVSGYFGATGKFPSPAKANLFADLTESPEFDSLEKFEALFPDWVAQAEADPDDIKPLDAFLNPAQEAYEAMRRSGTIPDPRDRQFLIELQKIESQQARRLEKLYSEVAPTETEEQKTGAYERLTEGAGADFGYRDLTDAELAGRFSKSQAQRAIAGVDANEVVMDPAVVQSQRSEYLDKTRGELTKEQRANLDALAQRFAFIYGEEFASHYSWETKNVVWDKHFDKFYARYILEANLCWAVLDSPLDPDGDYRKLAMQNIEWATNGAIKRDDDIYAVLKMLNIRGDPNNPLRASDELLNILYQGYYNARRKDFTQREVAIMWAADFGEDFLPSYVKPHYESFMKDFKPAIARAIMAYETRAIAAQKAIEHPEWAGMQEYERAQLQRPGVDPRAFLEALNDMVYDLAVSARGEDLGVEEIVETTLTTEPEPVRGKGWFGPERTLRGEQYVRAFLMKNFVLPAAGLPEEDKTDKVFRKLAQVGLAIAYTARAGMEDIVNDFGVGSKRFSDTLTEEEKEILFARGIDDEFSLTTAWRMGGAYTDKWYGKSNNWMQSAGAMGSVVARNLLRGFDDSHGTDLGDNENLVGALGLMMEFVPDILLDKGIVALARATRLQGINAVRRAAYAEKFPGTEHMGRGFVRLLGEEGALNATKESIQMAIGRLLLPKTMVLRLERAEQRVAELEKTLKATKGRKEIKRVWRELERARREVKDILQRPLWFDTMAEAIARGNTKRVVKPREKRAGEYLLPFEYRLTKPARVMTPQRRAANIVFMRRLFGISDEGLGGAPVIRPGEEVTTTVRRKGAVIRGERATREVTDLLDKVKADEVRLVNIKLARIAGSSDPGEIIDLMCDLKTSHGIVLQAPDHFVSKMHVWNRINNVYDNTAWLHIPLPFGKRLAGGVDDILEPMDAIGSMTNLGLPRGDKSGRAVLADLLRRAATADGATYSEIALKRRAVYEEMWDIIEENLSKRPITKRERLALMVLNWWSGAGIDLSKVKNRFDMYKAVKRIRVGGKGLLRVYGAAKDARKYFPIEDIDEVTGEVIIREGSKVSRKPMELIAAERRVSEAQARLAEAERLGFRGRKLEAAIDNLKVAESNLRLAKRIASRAETRPFIEGQLAKDLINRHNPHEIAMFSQSRMMKFETLLHLGLFAGYGPSIHGMTTAFRTLVLGTFGFPLKMAFSDEFWRLLPEGVWRSALFDNAKFRYARKSLAARNLDYKVIADNFSDILQNTDAWVGLTQDSPDYHLFLDAYIKMLRSGKEQAVNVLIRNPRLANESAGAYRKRLIKLIDELVFSETPEGFVLREHLRQMGRLPRATMAAWTKRGRDVATETHARLLKEAESAYFAVEETREATRRSIRNLSDEIGRIGSPTKKFKADWLRRNYSAPHVVGKRPSRPPAGIGKARLKRRTWEEVVREYDDDEILSVFGDVLKDKNIRARMNADYKRAKVRAMGKEAEYDELLRLREYQRALDEKYRLYRDRRKRLMKKGWVPEEPYHRRDPHYEKWLNQQVDHLLAIDNVPQLSRALREGATITKKDIKQIVASLPEGQRLPAVIGVKRIPRWGEGYVPGLSEFTEKGPFRLMDKVSNMLRGSTYTHYFTKHRDELLRAGLSEDVASGRAAHYARIQVEKTQYAHNMTQFEYMTRSLILFQQAYRQFAVYWSKQFVRHPFLMADIRDKFGSDFPAVRIPGTELETMVPMPFWMQGDFSEFSLPGFAPIFIQPFRVANYATGWRKGPDGRYFYDGATDLDWARELPPLSFTNKNTSPLTWVDDIFWGIAPGMLEPDPQDTWLGVMLSSFAMHPFRDPIKRQQLAMNIANAQIAAGIKPDFTKGIMEMRDRPGWWRLIEWVGMGFGLSDRSIVDNPDAILSAGTRLFNPFTGRVTYDPGMENADMAEMSFWERFSGSTPRTMADAQWEFMNAYGDEQKMKEVLRKFPRFAAVQRFWDLTIEEREQLLSDDRNLWMTPYVTGKYFYGEGGLPLVGGEFWDMLKSGGIYKKSLSHYYDSLEQTFKDVGWTRTIRKAESDYKQGLREADKFAQSVIAKEENPFLREQMRNQYRFYRNGWTKEAPGDEEREAIAMPPQWLVLAAREAGIEDDVFKWDPQAIARRMSDTYELVEDGGKRLSFFEAAKAKRLRSRWDHEGIWDRDDYEKKLGAARRVAAALEKYTSPAHKKNFGLDYAADVDGLREAIRRHDSYNEYLTEWFLKSEYWKIGNARELLRIGVSPKNLAAMERGIVDLQRLYADYRVKSEKLRPMSKEYLALRAEYIEKRNAIIERDGMEVFRDGPAGRIYASLGRNGLNVGRNWLRHAEAVLGRLNTDPRPVLERWLDSNPRSIDWDVRLERAAWCAISLAAIRYRRELASKWNEAMNAYGFSPESKVAQPYLQRLKYYAIMFSSASERFRKRLKRLGGDDLLKAMLDPKF